MSARADKLPNVRIDESDGVEPNELVEKFYQNKKLCLSLFGLFNIRLNGTELD